MRKLFLVAVLISCGGGGGSASLNPAFAGHWTGTTTTSISGFTPVYYSSYLDVAVSGDAATITSVCPDGSGSISTTGEGDSVLWSGSYQCPPVSIAGCSSVVFTFQSANLHVSGNTLTAQGSAVGTGCGVSRSTTFSFTGSK